ncbi:unnamed protein product [Amoebophrya sp. A120]|nr:unnamed protein product [Amoebophrya sp. A120]|eukprot:GSA120T00021717001.1
MMHPLSSIDALERKVAELEAVGDRDGVIECRIHQLASTQLLVDVHDLPIAAACHQHCLLSEAYSLGGYVAQALEHVHYGQQIVESQIYDNGPSHRLGSSLALAEGFAYVAEGKDYQLALQCLHKAATLLKQAYGPEDLQLARAYELLGKVTTTRKEYSTALEHLSQAWEIREHCLGWEHEQTLLLWLDMAWVHHLAGDQEEALSLQQSVVDKVIKVGKYPNLATDAALRLAKWTDTKTALDRLRDVEHLLRNHDAHHPRMVEIKRELALLLIKRREHDQALEYLADVQKLERGLYGQQSVQLARTLKAMGTVYMLKGNSYQSEAVDALRASLAIFEGNPSTSVAVIQDVKQKLQTLHPAANTSSTGRTTK